MEENNSKIAYKKSLINWSELSRFLTNGDRSGIRPDDIPLKYQKDVSELIKLIDQWAEKIKH